MGPIAGKKAAKVSFAAEAKLDSGALLAFNLIQRSLASNDLTALASITSAL